ncbi:MAG TPA: extracellular solute-binding protein, partial [Verrucomicrobiae bacterium]|nr:extracellular solute-binding protein [Verrucomicrobiae bacterium]
MKWMVLLLLLAASCAKPPNRTVEITYQTVETLPEQQAIHREIIAAFERAHTNIHVNVLYDTSKFQKLNVQLAGGVAPDVFYYIVDRLPALAQRGVLVDLSETVAPHAAEFFPEVVERCRIDGKLVMMPFHFSTDVLFYNRDWLAGESAPDNWTEFAETAP